MPLSPKEWDELSTHILADVLSEWRPGQKEAWNLFNQRGGPVALISGRRVGKTANALRFLVYKMLTTPGLQCAFMSKTVQEARETAFQDRRFGLLRIVPDEMIKRKDLSTSTVELVNGASLQLYGGRDPHKARGRGFGLLIFDEPAFYIGGWDVIRNVLIAFDAPRGAKKDILRAIKGKEQPVHHPADNSRRWVIFCTTPMRNEQTKQIMKKCAGRTLRIPTSVVLDYLDVEAKKEYYALKDTPYGRREFGAKVVWEGDQAVMTEKQITAAIERGRNAMAQREADEQEAAKRDLHLPRMWEKTIVSVDHAVGDIEREERSRSGIVVMSRFYPSKTDYSCIYIHADRSASGRAEDWISRACQAYHEFGAEEMVVETNQGGNLIKKAIHAYDPSIVVWGVPSTKSKAHRAVFAQQFGAQDRYYFGGDFPDLQDELMEFTGKSGPKDPKNDRADAFVQGSRRLIQREELMDVVPDEEYAAQDDAPEEFAREEGFGESGGDDDRVPDEFMRDYA